MSKKNTTLKAFASGKYPEIKIEGPNLYYASLLMDDFVSSKGEFAAANQYMYYHFITEGKNPHVAGTFKDIALVEMKHMEMLADLIIKLGGNPVFKGYHLPNWSPKDIIIGRNIQDRIIASINSEREGIENYQQHISLIHDNHVRSLLERIIDDEKTHLVLLGRALEKSHY